MSFGDVIRSAPSPGGSPSGIGGDSSVIWHCDYATDDIYELSTTDFSVVRTNTRTPSNPAGIGGNASVIWFSDTDLNKIYELSVTDFSIVRSISTSDKGIGGDSNTIWSCDAGTDLVYELSTTDFSVVRSASSPSIIPEGIGGDSSTILHSDLSSDKVYELSTTDFSIIVDAAAPATRSKGTGGKFDVIWHSDDVSNRVYELSTVLSIVSGTITSRSGIPLTRATITINGNTDTTDESGQYSIAITPGTYNITAEYPLLKTISQELVVSANMTQDLTMYKVESIRKFTGMGASLEGGTGCGMGKRRR